MKRLNRILQSKANRGSELIAKMIELSDDLEPKTLTVNLSAIPCKVDERGSFLVLTGTRDIPSGIGVENPPEMVLIYNEKGGVFVDTSSIRDFIRSHRENIKPEIDTTYSIMGVRLNIGVISSWIGEDFLTALHLSSLLDSQTETQA